MAVGVGHHYKPKRRKRAIDPRGRDPVLVALAAALHPNAPDSDIIALCQYVYRRRVVDGDPGSGV